MIILSLGVGVQSSTTLLMAQHGLFGKVPDYAIFADTGREPREVYNYLDYLRSVATIPILTVQKGDILEDLKDLMAGRKRRYDNPPFFAKNEQGKLGKMFRACTKAYKIEMVQQAIRRQVFNLKPRQRLPKGIHVEMWIGISTDEIERVKPSRTPWITNVHPLIDLMEMSRDDCKAWMAANGYRVPPKSSCTFCPFHSDAAWKALKASSSWPEIVEVDELIRNGLYGSKPGIELYLHRSLTPINEVDFSNSTEENLWGEECEGMCGM